MLTPEAFNKKEKEKNSHQEAVIDLGEQKQDETEQIEQDTQSSHEPIVEPPETSIVASEDGEMEAGTGSDAEEVDLLIRQLATTCTV